MSDHLDNEIGTRADYVLCLIDDKMGDFPEVIGNALVRPDKFQQPFDIVIVGGDLCVLVEPRMYRPSMGIECCDAHGMGDARFLQQGPYAISHFCNGGSREADEPDVAWFDTVHIDEFSDPCASDGSLSGTGAGPYQQPRVSWRRDDRLLLRVVVKFTNGR